MARLLSAVRCDDVDDADEVRRVVTHIGSAPCSDLDRRDTDGFGALHVGDRVVTNHPYALGMSGRSQSHPEGFGMRLLVARRSGAHDVLDKGVERPSPPRI